jgi:hypothetical protein
MNFDDSIEYAREHFFPRWDKNRIWTIKKCEDDEIHGAFGLCNLRTKTISISKSWNSIHLIIHEIAHAVTHQHHSKKWLKRMGKAAKKARELNNVKLSEEINAEIEFYANLPKLSAHTEAYNNIGDYVWEHPECSFEEVVEHVRKNFTMSAKDFIKHFKRAKKVYFNKSKDSLPSQILSS